MRTTYFSQGTQPGQAARPTPLHEQLAMPPNRPTRRALQQLAAAPTKKAATVEELTRDLAGWSLPQATAAGSHSIHWLW